MPSSMSRFPTGLNLGVSFHNHRISLESLQISVLERPSISGILTAGCYVSRGCGGDAGASEAV